MVSPVQILKEHPDIPDFYTLHVKYITGREDEFKIVIHKTEDGIISFWTKDDQHFWIPLQSIEKIGFGKDFTKLLKLQAEIDRKNKEAQNA